MCSALIHNITAADLPIHGFCYGAEGFSVGSDEAGHSGERNGWGVNPISGDGASVSVDTAELRRHRTVVDQQRGNVDHGLDAANHVVSLNDAYGTFCLPFAAMLDDVHVSTTTLLRTLSAKMSTTVTKLDVCADTYDSVDQVHARELDNTTGQLGD
ncbi:type VII secretion target [Nocardia halotolerans]|uniref:Type VII secretion target n=1 Tax=Nocardia halotolerans TaxID=1755878 RepID=A0ABV8VBW4_9NOCA